MVNYHQLAGACPSALIRDDEEIDAGRQFVQVNDPAAAVAFQPEFRHLLAEGVDDGEGGSRGSLREGVFHGHLRRGRVGRHRHFEVPRLALFRVGGSIAPFGYLGELRAPVSRASLMGGLFEQRPGQGARVGIVRAAMSSTSRRSSPSIL